MLSWQQAGGATTATRNRYESSPPMRSFVLLDLDPDVNILSVEWPMFLEGKKGTLNR